MTQASITNFGNLMEQTWDVNTVPHFIRHAAIFGALKSLKPRDSILIKVNHMPTPQLEQMQDLEGTFTHEVVQDGPDFWLVRLSREE